LEREWFAHKGTIKKMIQTELPGDFSFIEDYKMQKCSRRLISFLFELEKLKTPSLR
jgi:hypothetical protein